MSLDSPAAGCAALDTKELLRNVTIIPDLLAAHGSIGCDTVGAYGGIGKGEGNEALAHLQVANWKHALDASLLALSPSDYSLLPKTVQIGQL